jgi:hypothetical protein
VPHALSRLLVALAALEKPRQPGDDGEDLTGLLAGMDDPEPAPQPAAAKPSPTPATATPPAREWDGVPKTGRGLDKWACDRKALPAVNRVGASFGYPKRVTDWEPSQVAADYAILTTEPTANGKAR